MQLQRQDDERDARHVQVQALSEWQADPQVESDALWRHQHVRTTRAIGADRDRWNHLENDDLDKIHDVRCASVRESLTCQDLLRQEAGLGIVSKVFVRPIDCRSC